MGKITYTQRERDTLGRDYRKLILKKIDAYIGAQTSTKSFKAPTFI